MPSCRITNYTTHPLNVSLKHLCALHFENEIAPGQTVKLKPGRVWFTLEVLVDDKNNRYSVAQSAAAIAIVSLACVGTAALAVPTAAVATGAGMTTSLVTTAGAGLALAGETIIAGVGTALSTASTFVVAHAPMAAKISATFLPKAIELVEKEVGGFTAVQKEVVAIISSPNVSQDVRTQGFDILRRLGIAVAADRAAEKELAEEEKKKAGAAIQIVPDVPPPPYSKHAAEGSSSSSASSSSGLSSRPTLKKLNSSVTTLLHNLSAEERKDKKVAKQAAKEAKAVAAWEVVDIQDDLAEGKLLSSKERLRIHGLFMGERRHYEVREREGKLVLVDANTGETVVG